MIPATLLSFVRIKFEYTGRSRTSGTKADRETLLDIETAEYMPSDFQVVVELWAVDDIKRKKFKKILI